MDTISEVKMAELQAVGVPVSATQLSTSLSEKSDDLNVPDDTCLTEFFMKKFEKRCVPCLLGKQVLGKNMWLPQNENDFESRVHSISVEHLANICLECFSFAPRLLSSLALGMQGTLR